MASTGIKLIVGLGNPGAEYEKTRHNAGAWLVREIAQAFHQDFTLEKKFKSQLALIQDNCWLALPLTYMNQSGQAVKAIASFYKILPQQILVVHDELDFEPGIIRLKQGGGSGGHNGLKDIITQLGSADFYRLRIGIGHPGDRSQVHNYVLHQPSKADLLRITDNFSKIFPLLPKLLEGQISQSMQELHTEC